MKRIINKIFNPNKIIGFILVTLSIILMIYVFSFHYEKEIIAYITYLLSTYSLIIFVVWFYKLCKKINNKIKEHKLYTLYNENTFLITKTSLYLGAIINIIYSVFRLATGIYYFSFWDISFAVYYFLLSLMKFLLLRNIKEKEINNYD